MCLFNRRKSKQSKLEVKEKPASIVSLSSASPRTSQVSTGKRRPDQTLANPNPKSSSHSLSSPSPSRMSREERRRPMPRKTPGGLPEDPVVLGAPMPAGKQVQTNSKNDGYTSPPAHNSIEASNAANSDMFGSMNMAASVAVLTGGGDGGFAGGF